ncbi:MAG: cell division/cell wall cluster transcriptional repressor MraZ, partial [Synergistaceae bacterium]|nr:cell division/cell wall cluster transcriptional repressor MraZ [Synergistaceae bacterium]
LGQCVVATIGYGGKHVAVYSKSQWEIKKNELRSMPADNSKESVTRRMLLGYSYEQDIDSAGRILLPHQLRKRAGINQEVSINGNMDHLEIWDMNEWDSFGVGDSDWS